MYKVFDKRIFGDYWLFHPPICLSLNKVIWSYQLNLVSRAISHLKNTKSSEMVTFETIKVESRFDSLMELLDCRRQQSCSGGGGYWNDFKFCKRKTTAMRKRQLRRRPILTAAEFVIKNPQDGHHLLGF